MRPCGQWIVAAMSVAALAACHADPPAPAVPPPSEASVPASLPPPSPSARASTPAPDCVTATLNRLTLPERAGQVLMVGIAVNAPSGLGDTVRRYHLGGVFLHGRSTNRSGDLRAGISALQDRAALPLLISLDQEGGNVQTLKGPDFPLIPTAQRLGGGPPATLRNTTKDSARRLAAIGVSMNLAPIADTVPAGLGRGNPPIGAFRRQYGADPAQVATAVGTMVPASQGAGVLTVLKHFPGLGRVRANTDTSRKAVDDVATVDDPYLEPFRAGIRAGSAGVMISSASYPGLDRSTIAAFSKPIVTGLLRDRLGFRGLVISDDLGAGAAVSAVPTGQRAVRFVAAGGDLVLTIRPADAAPMVAALIDRAGKDQAFRSRLTDAARHVLEAKVRAGVLRCDGTPAT